MVDYTEFYKIMSFMGIIFINYIQCPNIAVIKGENQITLYVNNYIIDAVL